MPPNQDSFSVRLSALKNKQSAASSVPQETAPAAPVALAEAPKQDEHRPDAAPVGTGDHVVKDGECISSIAKEVGHFWQTIWDDSANEIIKTSRKQPNVLMPGDRVFVPPLQPKTEPGVTEKRHRFVRRGEPSHFATRILDQDLPRANEPFTLVIDEKQTITGVTDAEGKIDVPIPGDACIGKLSVGAEPDVLKLTIQFGGLDPIATWKGVQTRLKNLGFPCDVTGEKDEQTLESLNEFRESAGLPRSDDIDEATRSQLQSKHGS